MLPLFRTIESNVLVRIPAAVRSASATAVSATMNEARRRRRRLEPVPPRLVSPKAVEGSTREAWSAGAAPRSAAASSDTSTP